MWFLDNSITIFMIFHYIHFDSFYHPKVSQNFSIEFISNDYGVHILQLLIL